MADSVTAANLPAGFDLYAGYVDGRYANYNQIAAMYPGKTVGIAVFSTTNAGTVGDCENGDMTPQTSVNWVVMRRKAGITPTIYCSASAWPTVQRSFQTWGVAQPQYWIAAYPGPGPVLYPGAIAHQWIDRGPYDESVVADYWPGVDPAPSPPEEEEMPLYATDSAGTGFIIATDLSSKTGMPDAADANALLATGLYKGVQLTDTLLNSIPTA